MSAPPPLSLYLHFPWCVKKCPYCDFNSHSSTGPVDQDGYISALIRDLDFELEGWPEPTPLNSIFMGGGTPSLFTPPRMASLLEQIRVRLPFDDGCERTMEANPGTTEHHDFNAYRCAGINRLSIGVQSFDDAQLKTLGRIHSAEEAKRAFAAARAGGFDNINIDLMFALPGQTSDGALGDLEAAIRLEPDHISLYQLTIEPNTVFYRYPPRLPGSDRVMEMQTALQEKLAASGYDQYEISAYARPGKRCRHNLGYWQFSDYVGIGAGAHGKRTRNEVVVRRARKKHPGNYQRAAGSVDAIAEDRVVHRTELLFEFLMNGLRLKHGVSMELASARSGATQSEIERRLAPSISDGLLTIHKGMLCCSDRGYLFLDDVLAELL